jgi:hypothetical protein
LNPVYGDNRFNLFHNSYVTCLPSFSEVIGLVNIESALMGRLVITTPYAGIDEMANEGGIICGNDLKSLQIALKAVMNLSQVEYNLRSESLRTWALDNFSPEIIMQRWATQIDELITRTV